MTANRLSDYVSVTLNTATILYSGHITYCTGFFQDSQVYLSLCLDGKCDCYTNKLSGPGQTKPCLCVSQEGKDR